MCGLDKPVPVASLPFDLAGELGEIALAFLEAPGVYYLSVRQDSLPAEYYAVTADAPAISAEARSYGRAFARVPGLRLYDLDDVSGGRLIVEFEICRFLTAQRILPEGHITLHEIALEAMEQNPEYFGPLPAPAVTPQGYTVRYRTLASGVFWLETDQCEQLLAVCYPLWKAVLSDTEQALGEQTLYDRALGIEQTLGYLFFPQRASCIPLLELLAAHPEWERDGTVDRAALANAVCGFYPAYAEQYNAAVRTPEDRLEAAPDAGFAFVKFY